ncbi:hypothetical protein Barb6XT_02104 [Bacteroidales bacterium Barb6XT]|nr:hypothetical protein Barb6XT_02104 [Bacteroidales bacterium Barb6XT]
MRSYVDGLLNLDIIITRGVKKGNEFLVNPQIIANSKTNIKTSLKTVEPYRLMALIEEDLRLHSKSTRREIHQRLPDVSEKDMKKYLYEMVNAGKLCTEGSKTFRRYRLA